MRRRIAARLRCALHFALLHLLLTLHLHVALLLLHLHGALFLHHALLLCLLVAGALLLLNLRLALLLHLLVTHALLLFLRLPLLLYLLVAGTLLCIHLRLTLLLHLLFAHALLLRLLVARALLLLHLCLALLLGLLCACTLLRIALRLPLLLRGTVVDLLRRAFDRAHHRKPARRGCISLRLACRSDHGCARQRRRFARVREARGGQLVGALWRAAHRVHGSLDRMHRVLEWLGGTRAACRRFAGTRCHDRTCRLGARRRFRGSRRCGAMQRTDGGGTSGCADGRGNQFHAIVARCRTRLLQILQLRGAQRLAVLAGDDFLARGKIDGTRRWLVARDHRASERLATALEHRGPRGWAAQTKAAPVRIDARAHGDLGACKLGAIQFERSGAYRPGAREHVARYGGHRAGQVAIGVVVSATS